MGYQWDTSGSGTLLLHYFMRRPAAAGLNARMSLKSRSHSCQQEDTVTFYCETVIYLLKTYAIDDIIAKRDAGMMPLPQPSNRAPTAYVEARWNRALRCDRACDECCLRGIFVKDFPKSIRHRMPSYWVLTTNAAVHDLARHETSSAFLQIVRTLQMHPVLTTGRIKCV